MFVALPDGGFASPAQEEAPERDRAASDGAVVDIDIDIEVSLENAAEVATTLEDLQNNLDEQLRTYNDAEKAVEDAIKALADVNAGIQDLNFRIEELTLKSDAVVSSAFVSPPSAGALDLITTASVTDLAVKQSMLNMQAGEDADVLSELAAARSDLEDFLKAQSEQQQAAVEAQADATEALTNLQASLDQHTEFMLMVQSNIGADGDIPPELASDAEALTTLLQDIEEATAAERAQKELEERLKREAESGAFNCPVSQDYNFEDTWGAARSGGRSHQGTDIMAPTGTPTIAPVSGRVEHRSSGLGGMSWYVYDDNGDTHYGAHLSSYANQGAGWVPAGTIIGYVGSTGNAQADAPHLHYEFHPGGGSPTNPYQKLVAACG